MKNTFCTSVFLENRDKTLDSTITADYSYKLTTTVSRQQQILIKIDSVQPAEQ